LHLTTTSIIFESNEIKTPLYKFLIDDNFKTRYFTLLDIINYYNFFVPEKEKINLINANNNMNNLNIINNQLDSINLNCNQNSINNLNLQHNKNNQNNHVSLNSNTQNISFALNRKNSKLIIAGHNINLNNNINPTNENNSYSKRISKKFNKLSPKHSNSMNFNIMGNGNSNKENLNNIRLKRELNLTINCLVDSFEKTLTKIFKNENYLFLKKGASSEEKKRSSKLLKEENINSNDNNINNDINNFGLTRGKSIIETPTNMINNFISRKSNLVNPIINKKNSVSNHNQLKKEGSNLYQNNYMNTIPNTQNVQSQDKFIQGNPNNNNNLNNSFLSNHVSGYSELLNYFKENNINLNRFVEFFYLLNIQFNLMNNNFNSNNISNNNQTNSLNLNNQDNKNIKSNYNSNSDQQSSLNNHLNNYSVFLGKGCKYKLISRDKIKPYKECKNIINFIFILEGKNSEILKYYEDINFVLTELLINKQYDESKLSANIFDKRINTFLSEKIYCKSDIVNMNYNNLFSNINSPSNNANLSSQIHYNLYNNFSVIQEESNNNHLINSNTVGSNDANNNQISSDHGGQFFFRNHTLSSNNLILKKKTPEDKINKQGNHIILHENPVKQSSSVQINNSSNNNFSSNNSNKNNQNSNGVLHFNAVNIHNLINMQNNCYKSINFYTTFLNGELANIPLLNNKYEFILKATRLHPEKNQKGVFIIDKRKNVEFHPLINNPKKNFLKFNLKDVRFVMKYRYLYDYKALNLHLMNYKQQKIIIFESEKEANDVLFYMYENCDRIDKMKYDIKSYTNLWVDGYISNFDYLIYLNEMACRSFSDLSQYPVMPWVINNFKDEDCK